MAPTFSISKLSKHQVTLAFVSLFAIIVYINPTIVNYLNSTILGRLVAVIIIIFFASRSLVAGLLVSLIIVGIMQTTTYQEGLKGKNKKPNVKKAIQNKKDNIKDKIKDKINDKLELTCNAGYKFVKGKCDPSGSKHGCTKGFYNYCEKIAA